MDNLKEIICNNYNIDIVDIEKNTESTDGNVYIIKSINNKYVIKIYDDIEHANTMIKVHNYLYNNDIIVPKIINTKYSNNYIELNSKYIVLYSFLDGIQVRNKNSGESDIERIAKVLRQMHDITSNNDLDLKPIPFSIQDSKRNSLLHFDLTRSNIFDINGNIGFIDFDDAKYGQSVCDVAILISIFFFSKKRGVNLDGLNLFLDNYYEDDLILRNEESKYIKKYALAWIDYIMNGNHFDTSTVESFKIKRELIEKYMK